MASSKFSAAPPAYKQLAICKPAPPPFPPFFPPRLLQSVSAFARWTDLDPAATRNVALTFPLDLDAAGQAYSGSGKNADYQLELTITRLADPATWKGQLSMRFQDSPPESVTYPFITVDPNRPFDTGFFGDTVIPGVDFRLIRALE
jgi:hypothetical protein